MNLVSLKQRAARMLMVLGIGLVVFFSLKLKACLTPAINDNRLQLKPGELVRVRYDSRTHKLTTITPTKTETVYADNPIIHIAPGGYILSETHAVGRRFSPFIGLGGGDTLRLYTGIQFFHFWRFGINGGLAFTASKQDVAIIPLVAGSYNFYGSLDLYAGVNPMGAVQASNKPLSYVQLGCLVRFW